jgi:hypothetical protein
MKDKVPAAAPLVPPDTGASHIEPPAFFTCREGEGGKGKRRDRGKEKGPREVNGCLGRDTVKGLQ